MRQIMAFVLTIGVAGSAAAQEVVAAEQVVPAIEEVVTDASPVEAEIEIEVEVEVPEVQGLQILSAADVSLADFMWIARPVVVFADSAADPRFAEQMELLLARPEELIERGVVVLTDTDPKGRSDVRLKLRPRGFQLTLLDKDGTVNLRKPAPWNVRELTRAIDKMPSRKQEIREQKELVRETTFPPGGR